MHLMEVVHVNLCLALPGIVIYKKIKPLKRTFDLPADSQKGLLTTDTPQ